MVAIAAGDEIAVDLLAPAVLRVAHPRPAGIEIIDRKRLRFPDDAAACRLTCIRQIFLYLGLAIDHHASAGKTLQIDPVRAAVEREFDAVVRKTLAHHPRPDTSLVQQIDRAPLEQSGPDARLDILTRLPLKDDGFDAARVQQLGQQQPGRARADDGDLGFGHGSSASDAHRAQPEASD